MIYFNCKTSLNNYKKEAVRQKGIFAPRHCAKRCARARTHLSRRFPLALSWNACRNPINLMSRKPFLIFLQALPLMLILASPVLARASVAAGADALLIEVHSNPDKAFYDGAQSMFPAQFITLMRELRLIAPAFGRSGR